MQLRTMRIIRFLVSALADAGGYVAAAAVLAMAVLVSFDVLARFLLGSGTKMAVEVTGYLLVAIVFFGLAYAHKEKAHIRVEFFVKILPSGLQIWVRLFGSALFLFVTILLGTFGWDSVQTSVQYNTTSRTGLDVAIWPYQLAIPLGLFLVGILLVVHVIDDLRAIAAPRESDKIGPPS
jgi:TRAP-type C4-dicarboxylate transport system permease small subunit